MALTEETVNDKIEVVNKGTYSLVQVRKATIIKRDGVEISRSFHRTSIMPDADLSGLDSDVSAVCTTVFTDACKAGWATVLASLNEE
tara:strand:+ start:241 stop:501 length:261 start_codon:yes stop_codon:yes gene_type:complete